MAFRDPELVLHIQTSAEGAPRLLDRERLTCASGVDKWFATGRVFIQGVHSRRRTPQCRPHFSNNAGENVIVRCLPIGSFNWARNPEPSSALKLRNPQAGRPHRAGKSRGPSQDSDMHGAEVSRADQTNIHLGRLRTSARRRAAPSIRTADATAARPRQIIDLRQPDSTAGQCKTGHAAYFPLKNLDLTAGTGIC